MSAESFVKAWRDVLAEAGGSPRHRKAVIYALVYEIKVFETDISLIFARPVAGRSPNAGGDERRV